MATDREIWKDRQNGQAQAFGLAADPRTGVVADVNRRTICAAKFGTENAATNVAEVACGVVNRKARCVSIKYTSVTAIANDATDYVHIKAYKRTSAGASLTLLGSWNSATGAQGATTASVPASLSLVDNSDLDIAAGSPISYIITKFGAGKLVDVGSFTFDVEEK